VKRAFYSYPIIQKNCLIFDKDESRGAALTAVCLTQQAGSRSVEKLTLEIARTPLGATCL
jgi:hypothetical protein